MKALLIANGALPRAAILKKLAISADLIVCADGGANSARRLSIKPDVILGDFDSIKATTRKYFRAVPQVFMPDQESTDLEKGIKFCIGMKIRSLDIVGATGSRADHSTGSLGCFKKFAGKIRIKLIEPEGEIRLLKNGIRLKAFKGEKISLIPLGRCSGITTKNLRYPLKNDFLELGIREGISNEATASEISVSFKSGTLLLYRFRHT